MNPLHHITDRAARDLHAVIDFRGAQRRHVVIDGADRTTRQTAGGFIAGLQRIVVVGLVAIGIGK